VKPRKIRLLSVMTVKNQSPPPYKKDESNKSFQSSQAKLALHEEPSRRVIKKQSLSPAIVTRHTGKGPIAPIPSKTRGTSPMGTIEDYISEWNQHKQSREMKRQRAQDLVYLTRGRIDHNIKTYLDQVQTRVDDTRKKLAERNAMAIDQVQGFTDQALQNTNQKYNTVINQLLSDARSISP
jgi:hypothetical protein